MGSSGLYHHKRTKTVASIKCKEYGLCLEMPIQVSLTELLRAAQPSTCLSTAQLLSTQPLWEDRSVYLGVYTSNRQKKVICLALLEFLPEDRLGSWLFHEMGACLFTTSDIALGFIGILPPSCFHSPPRCWDWWWKWPLLGRCCYWWSPCSGNPHAFHSVPDLFQNNPKKGLCRN